jgi:hypothetical protein
MGNRTTRWLGVGVLSGGLAVALIVGAGTASAGPDADATGVEATSSAGREPAGNGSTGEGPAQSIGPATISTDSVDIGEGKTDPSIEGDATVDNLTVDEPGDSLVDEPQAPVEEPTEESVDEPARQPAEEPQALADQPADQTETGLPGHAARAADAGQQSDIAQDGVAVETAATAATAGTEATATEATATEANATETAAAEATATEANATETEAETAPAAESPRNAARALAVDLAEAPAPAERAPAAAALAMAAAPDTAAARKSTPILLNLIGSVIFGLYSMVLRLFEGPPVLPRGSTVTVETSTLTIDCGNGLEVPANWYFPSDPEPERLIYLQHGFMASAPFYSRTAAYLAEQTHSIVVALSITSNFFACDSCWLGGDAMHRAIAKIFNGDRGALTESASEAVGHPVTLPSRFAIAGHSAGGGLALGVAGYLNDDAMDDLAGILLLDGVALGDVKASAVIGELPEDLPILQISSPAYMWNLFGNTSLDLARARPGRFNGVELTGGSHIDLMQGGNPIIQFSAYLIAGFSSQKNIRATRMLAADWLTEMFAGGDDFGGVPGESMPIVTDAGTATAVALPASESSLSPFERLLKSVFISLAQFLFALVSPTGSNSVGLAREQEISTPIAA